MKSLPVLLALATTLASAPAQEAPGEKITTAMLAEFLSIESFEVEYELPESTKDVNIQLHFTTLDENGKEKDDTTLVGVGQIYREKPTELKQKLLVMVSPDKSVLFEWRTSEKKFSASAWSEGWKRPLEKVEQTSSSLERDTLQLKHDLKSRPVLKTWRKLAKPVAILTLEITAKDEIKE